MRVLTALRGEPIIVHGDGKQSRDFTFVGTVCATIVDALDREVAFDGPVNLAFGSQVTLLELIDLISEEIGHELAVEHVEPRPGDIRRSKADPGRLLALFPGLQPVEIGAGVRQTIEWFRDTAPK